jgi:hypothetical protein
MNIIDDQDRIRQIERETEIGAAIGRSLQVDTTTELLEFLAELALLHFQKMLVIVLSTPHRLLGERIRLIINEVTLILFILYLLLLHFQTRNATRYKLNL